MSCFLLLLSLRIGWFAAETSESVLLLCKCQTETNAYKYLRFVKVEEALNNSVKFSQQEATTVQILQTL